MRVLMIHNRSMKPGGEEESTALEVAMLRKYGHEVTLYEESNERVVEIGTIRTGFRATWSREAFSRVSRMLAKHPFDLVHVQNFFPLLSPSVHWAARAAGVTVVQTLRTYRLVCADAFFFRDGAPCEDCLGRVIPWPAVWHGCYRGRLASAAVATSLTAHRVLGTWHSKVDAFICLTEFARGKMAEGGLPHDRLHVKPNFLAPDPGPGPGGEAFLFVGRLSPEKGLGTLLRAWERMSDPPPLRIIGDGPLADQVRAAASCTPSIEWLGRRPLDAVVAEMARSKALIFPSEWYETFGRVGAEAMATGTPVIASRLGALAEMVAPEENGLHFTPGDADDLARAVDALRQAPTEPLRTGARRTFEERYTEEANYRTLISIYETALERASARS